jgi:hypothetical protein
MSYKFSIAGPGVGAPSDPESLPDEEFARCVVGFRRHGACSDLGGQCLSLA